MRHESSNIAHFVKLSMQFFFPFNFFYCTVRFCLIGSNKWSLYWGFFSPHFQSVDNQWSARTQLRNTVISLHVIRTVCHVIHKDSSLLPDRKENSIDFFRIRYSVYATPIQRDCASDPNKSGVKFWHCRKRINQSSTLSAVQNGLLGLLSSQLWPVWNDFKSTYFLRNEFGWHYSFSGKL